MRQLVQSIDTGDIRLVEVPEPMPSPGRVVVRASASLLSAGTERMLMDFAEKNLFEKAKARPDLVRQTLDKARREGIAATKDAVQNRLSQPMPVGYSCAGTVIAVGEGISRFAVGDRVACGGGGYAVHAEVVSVPENLVVRIPDQVSFDEASFATVGSVALHGLRLSGAQFGDRVAVLGLGLIGQLSVQLLAAAGCEVIGFDPKPERAALALKSGADKAVSSDDEMRSMCEAHSAGYGVDQVLITADTTSNAPVELAGEVARDRGSVVAVGAVGTSLPRSTYFEKELHFQISRSYGPGRYDFEYEEKGHDYPVGYVRWTENRNMQAFVDAIHRGRISPDSLITHRFPISQGASAFEVISGGTGEDFMGVILEHEGDDASPDPVRRRVDLGAKTIATSAAGGGVRVGIVGAGNFVTSTLLPAIQSIPDLNLTAVCSQSGLSARHVADKFGFSYCATDAHQLIGDPQLDAIVIATPHHLHAQQVVAALGAGKHVYCEKPLCLTESELDEIVDAMRESEGMVQVGYNRRFAPLALELRRFAAGRRGPLMINYRVNAGPLPPDHWLLDPQRGGGRLIGEGCHFVDFLMYLADALPVRVRTVGAFGGSRSQAEDVLVTLEFENGSVGTIAYSGSGDRAASKERVEVMGGGSMMILDDFKSLQLVHGGKRRTSTARFRQDKGHRGSMEAFVSAARRGGPPPISYDHLVVGTRCTLRAAEASRHSEALSVEAEVTQAE